MSNKNKAAKSKESKQRTKVTNSNRQKNLKQSGYTRNGRRLRNSRSSINAVQLAFLQQIGEIPSDYHKNAICHGTS